MKNLISINKQQINQETVDTVSARELHGFLEVQSKFADWVTRRISEYGFVINKDYIIVSQKKETLTNNNEPRVTTLNEYHITLDMAKELSMVERNDKGREARQYFIECEKQLKEKEVATPTIGNIEDLIRGIQVVVEFTSLSPDAKETLFITTVEDNFNVKIPYRPVIEQKTYSASEIGEMMGISANKVGKLANAHGLKTPAYGKVYLSKSPHSVKQVETFRYYSNVIPVLQALI